VSHLKSKDTPPTPHERDTPGMTVSRGADSYGMCYTIRMHSEFSYPIGGKDFRSQKPAFFNRRKKRPQGGRPHGHFGLAERDDAPVVPALPSTPPPAAFEANVFGRFDVRLQHAIGEAGYAVPTPIQEKAIPFLLEGRDLIGCAQTGTGKTAAFMLPILDNLLKGQAPKRGSRISDSKSQISDCQSPDPDSQDQSPKTKDPRPKTQAGHPRALILSPTRELAAQTAENTAKFSKYTGLPFAVVFGGVSQFPQVKALQKGAETVIATPGRLIDLMTQGVVYLDRVEFFVLDEADRMLDMGFWPDIKRILSKLPVRRQSLFFSATLSPEILKLAGELVHDPMQVMISPETPTVEKINQKCMFVEKGNKDNLLIHLLQNHAEWYRVIVFARTRHGADRVEKKLGRQDIPVAAIHSDKTQNQRMRAPQGFKDGKLRVLVATDIASRGIDVPDVDLVVNMELPVETESYVHRIGRTARAGARGAAISFVAPEERNLLKAVERYIRKTVPVDRDQPFHSETAEQKAGKQNEGMPQAPWIRGGARNGKGNLRHPGARFWGQPKPEKKFVHPANAKKAKRNRTNYQGRREPDFGQK